MSITITDVSCQLMIGKLSGSFATKVIVAPSVVLLQNPDLRRVDVRLGAGLPKTKTKVIVAPSVVQLPNPDLRRVDVRLVAGLPRSSSQTIRLLSLFVAPNSGTVQHKWYSYLTSTLPWPPSVLYPYILFNLLSFLLLSTGTVLIYVSSG